MSAEVDWLLATLNSVVAAQPTDHPLYRVDRDETRTYTAAGALGTVPSVRSREGELQEANFVGVALADSVPTAEINDTERVEVTLSVRLEGLHHEQFGHVDPAGTEGVPWQGLLDDVREAIRAERSYPAVGRPGIKYHTALITVEAPQSSQHRDYFRHDMDITLRGHSTS